MDFLLNLLIMAVVAGWMFIVGWLRRRKTKQRSQRCRTAAETLGLFFAENVDKRTIAPLAEFSLFRQGAGRFATDWVEGDSGDVKISIFNYRYVTGSGNNARNHDQTVSMIQSPQLQCPEFSLRPASLMNRIASAAGMARIEFDSHPEFSQRFVLEASDESAVVEFFSSTVLDHFVDQSGTFFEARGETLIYYRPQHRMKPERLKEWLARAYEMYGVLLQRH